MRSINNQNTGGDEDGFDPRSPDGFGRSAADYVALRRNGAHLLPLESFASLVAACAARCELSDPAEIQRELGRGAPRRGP